MTGQNVEELAFVDQGYTGDTAAECRADVRHSAAGDQAPRSRTQLRAAAAALGGGTQLRLAGARFRLLARDYECLPRTVKGLHFLVFVCLRCCPRRSPYRRARVHNRLW